MKHRRHALALISSFLATTFALLPSAPADDGVYEIVVRAKPFEKFKREFVLMKRQLKMACDGRQKTSTTRATLAQMTEENSEKQIRLINDEVVKISQEKQDAEKTARDRLQARIKEAEEKLQYELEQLEVVRAKGQDTKEYAEQKKKLQQARILVKVRKEKITEDQVKKLKETLEENSMRELETLVVISDRFEKLANEARLCEAKITKSGSPSPYVENPVEVTIERPTQPPSESVSASASTAPAQTATRTEAVPQNATNTSRSIVAPQVQPISSGSFPPIQTLQSGQISSESKGSTSAP